MRTGAKVMAGRNVPIEDGSSSDSEGPPELEDMSSSIKVRQKIDRGVTRAAVHAKREAKALPQPPLTNGTRVTLEGLSKAELNGAAGRVVAHFPDTGRRAPEPLP